jgi:hypothetical protein
MDADTKGKRSPQWAFMSRLKIGKPDVGLYPDRLRIIATPWFGVYLHHIVRPDADPDPHDHPWPFGSLVLRGWYEEELHPIPHVFLARREPWRYRRLSWHTMPRDQAHRITDISPGGVWTLVLVGRRRGTWGFHTPYGFVPWQDYVS